jgi:hypothetical protein
MDPDLRQIGMSVNTALPSVTRNFMRDVVKLSNKIRYRYLWSFGGSILAFAGLDSASCVFGICKSSSG